jgi:hypothetical protein
MVTIHPKYAQARDDTRLSGWRFDCLANAVHKAAMISGGASHTLVARISLHVSEALPFLNLWFMELGGSVP